MSSTPSTDAEWANLIHNFNDRVPERSSSQPAIPLGVPRMIDHTLLSWPVESKDIDALCADAQKYDFASVCVRLENVSRAAENLRTTPNIAVACVVGFPEGTHDTVDKVREAKDAVNQGARELDMVINYPELKNGLYKSVYEDITAVRKAAPSPIILKAIVESAELDRDQLIAASVVACMAGADFVKTSTGYKGPATVSSVTIMRLVVELFGTNCKVKASGGIRNASDCLKMIKAGATRIGTSSGIKIVQELDEGEILEQGAGHAVY
ncbi:hypothetical protein N7462_001822 [Penicillium macrosclerotiorum]|uniref:uncharacterized protein n=1 Tax=Penicillium macrosclerotiorum TaxID=303699 RepID=UPI00254703FC|nr:uncharacterized protein N7462_001822 [Penicillium macrosclerotiorum]KAJ5692399.1 hypothetical protein N7462_001822 [Penicillium macrosclerotiorum]